MIRVDGISTFSFHQPESWSWFNIQTWRKSVLRILASWNRKFKSVGISTGEYDIFYYYIDPRHPGTLPAESIWVAALQCSQWAIMPWTQWHLPATDNEHRRTLLMWLDLHWQYPTKEPDNQHLPSSQVHAVDYSIWNWVVIHYKTPLTNRLRFVGFLFNFVTHWNYWVCSRLAIHRSWLTVGCVSSRDFLKPFCIHFVRAVNNNPTCCTYHILP